MGRVAVRDSTIGDAGNMRSTGGAGVLPVLVLGLACLAALVALTLTRPGPEGQYVILWPPRLPPAHIINRVFEEGGGVVGFGGLPGVSMVISDRADFPARIRLRGALAVLSAPASLGCVAPAPGSRP